MKAKEIQEICDKILPGASENIKNGRCPDCKRRISDIPFKDSISKQEYHISGLCQICQDKVFG